MRWLTGLLLSSLAFAAASAPMGEDDARHLLGRTVFGATPEAVTEFAGLSRAEAVERLLNGARTAPVNAPPSAALEYTPPARIRSLSDEDRKAFQREQRQNGLELRAWWADEMLVSDSPLTEHMTLFWHNHFVSSIAKVKSPRLMLDQNLLLRREALGNFATMLHDVSKDPAMLVYLDSASNRRGSPNENFAREVMELFTLGVGHYGEPDIKEAARAFTGWSIEPATGAYKWRPFAHDRGIKTVLGRSGDFDGDAVLDILLSRPETAEFVVRKLWLEFVSPQPDEAEVRRIARDFHSSGYEIKVALRDLLNSPAFWGPENRAVLVKSPADLVIGTLRSIDYADAEARPVAVALRQLGQDLFAPPNVKGWPGGDVWINSSTLLARKQVLERIARSMRGRSLDRTVLLDPTYQLK
jgi:uncharacterized protein (DUF1800 family)